MKKHTQSGGEVDNKDCQNKGISQTIILKNFNTKSSEIYKMFRIWMGNKFFQDGTWYGGII